MKIKNLVLISLLGIWASTATAATYTAQEAGMKSATAKGYVGEKQKCYAEVFTNYASRYEGRAIQFTLSRRLGSRLLGLRRRLRGPAVSGSGVFG